MTGRRTSPASRRTRAELCRWLATNTRPGNLVPTPGRSVLRLPRRLLGLLLTIGLLPRRLLRLLLAIGLLPVLRLALARLAKWLLTGRLLTVPT